MDNQRLRNLTTRRLHTKMDDIYHDIEYFVGAQGIMTHQLPNACEALTPFLKGKITEPRFWDGKFDVTHEGETEIAPLNKEEVEQFWKNYGALPNPLSRIGTAHE